MCPVKRAALALPFLLGATPPQPCHVLTGQAVIETGESGSTH